MQGQQEFHFKADLQFLPPINVPIATLQSQVFEKTGITGRPLGLVSTLSQSIVGLQDVLELRNRLILSFDEQKLTSDRLAPLYFGLPTERGRDERYSTAVNAIYTYTDDCVYFSQMLAGDLCAYGNRLKKRFEKRFRGPAPFVVQIDTSNAEKQGLLPPAANYKDWETAYVSVPPIDSSLRGKLRRVFRRDATTPTKPSI